MKHLTNFKLFENSDYDLFFLKLILEKLYIKSHIYKGYSRFGVSFEIYLDKDHIGICELEVLPKKEDFNDKIDDIKYGKSIDFDSTDCKKSDVLKHKHILIISGFEIFEEYQNKGLGIKSMKKILNYIIDKFPNNIGIYLFVFGENIPAVKIYKKIGFKTIHTEKCVSPHPGQETILTMRYK